VKIAIDTNSYIAFLKGEEKAVSTIRTASKIIIPLIVLAELRAGFAFGTHIEKNERSLMKFLSSERVSIICPDEETTFHYSSIFSELKKAGKPIPTNDLWIASLVKQNSLFLLTYDKHFSYIKNLALV